MQLQPAGDVAGAAEIGADEDCGELLAAVAHDEIAGAHYGLGQHARDADETVVAGLMTEQAL